MKIFFFFPFSFYSMYIFFCFSFIHPLFLIFKFLSSPQVKLNGAPHARDRATIKRLQMYRGGKARYNRKGRLVQAAAFQNKLAPGALCTKRFVTPFSAFHCYYYNLGIGMQYSFAMVNVKRFFFIDQGQIDLSIEESLSVAFDSVLL